MPDFIEFSLTQWLAFLENRHYQPIQLGLTRVAQVAERLNLKNFDIPVITVAGTNGKGSTVAALEAIYLAGGYQVGSYTSPHLLAFNERICVNKKPIQDEDLCQAFAAIEKGRGNTHLTYFEMATLAAFWYFKQFKLDIIILEVGMGGRQDATNIIDSDAAILTTVDLDHQYFLGDTKEAIGFEKVGVARAGKPLIYADNSPPLSVIKETQKLNSPFYCLGKQYSFQSESSSLAIFLQEELLVKVAQPSIHDHAAVAAVIASRCINHLLPITKDHWKEGLSKVSIRGRRQVVAGSVTTIFDVAHNPQAASLLADFILKRSSPYGSIRAVFSALKDKDLCGLIKPLLNSVDFWYPAVLNDKRAASSNEINEAFNQLLKDKPFCFASPESAYVRALQEAQSGDTILVFGSFLTVGAVMKAIEGNNLALKEEE